MNTKQNKTWIVARDKPGLLIAMMKHLSGNAHISFEGDLSHCNFDKLPIEYSESSLLRRATTHPVLDFVVLPLNEATLQGILNAVLPQARCVHDVIHIQIEANGELMFGAYDNFHKECIVVSDKIPISFLDKLLCSGVIRSYQIVPADTPRWHG